MKPDSITYRLILLAVRREYSTNTDKFSSKNKRKSEVDPVLASCRRASSCPSMLGNRRSIKKTLDEEKLALGRGGGRSNGKSKGRECKECDRRARGSAALSRNRLAMLRPRQTRGSTENHFEPMSTKCEQDKAGERAKDG
ncbi:hypothetical protein EVAR_54239_1 [Eumeta japonica]|uniref:Uncharacterized protein n=1 Tax=Eumeta variegata TaxID=151549 RepID=A0A4C1YKH0_EUMVA|nr:hypothetical protein EVAR_54239_1 [Eumeta japonica]